MSMAKKLLRYVYGRSKRAFDTVLRCYRSPVRGALHVEFKADVSKVVNTFLKTKEQQAWFWKAYSFDSPNPIEIEQFVTLMLGDRRHGWEQRLGQKFTDLGIYPLSKYHAGIHLHWWESGNVGIQSFSANSGCMTDIPNILAADVAEKSEGWMSACHETHTHCNETLFAPHDEYDGLPPEPGYVYVMRDPDKQEQVKIGKARNPEKRLRGLKTACPDIEILFTIFVDDMDGEEDYYHRRFAADRRGISEWFYISSDLRKWIDSKGNIDVFEDDDIKDVFEEEVEDASIS